MKSSKVSIKTRSTPASLSFKGQATKHTTVKWSIQTSNIITDCLRNCIPIIGMESPFHSKVVCSVFLAGKFDRNLSNMEVNCENL